jgi:hypothetical protein
MRFQYSADVTLQQLLLYASFVPQQTMYCRLASLQYSRGIFRNDQEDWLAVPITGNRITRSAKVFEAAPNIFTTALNSIRAAASDRCSNVSTRYKSGLLKPAGTRQW